MSMLTRRDTRDPFFHAIDRLFNEPLMLSAEMPGAIARLEEGFLPVDVSETDTHVLVRASVPGFRKEDIDAEIRENVLTIKAERREEREEKSERYFRKELRWGSLSRRVALPSVVNERDVGAELKDGVLTLRIPKAAEATPRKIKIG